MPVLEATYAYEHIELMVTTLHLALLLPMLLLLLAEADFRVFICGSLSVLFNTPWCKEDRAVLPQPFQLFCCSRHHTYRASLNAKLDPRSHG